jgi:hypothetical protein
VAERQAADSGATICNTYEHRHGAFFDQVVLWISSGRLPRGNALADWRPAVQADLVGALMVGAWWAERMLRTIVKQPPRPRVVREPGSGLNVQPGAEAGGAGTAPRGRASDFSSRTDILPTTRTECATTKTVRFCGDTIGDGCLAVVLKRTS